MKRTLMQPGGADGDWKVVVVIWAALAAIVVVTTDAGLLASVVGTAGAYFVYRGVRALWHVLVSGSVEQAAIGSLGGHDGPVEIEGTARAVEDPVVAPMTETESVAYRVQVTQHVPSSDGGGP